MALLSADEETERTAGHPNRYQGDRLMLPVGNAAKKKALTGSLRSMFETTRLHRRHNLYSTLEFDLILLYLAPATTREASPIGNNLHETGRHVNNCLSWKREKGTFFFYPKKK